MKVTLLHSTPLWVAAQAIRTCWDSHDKSDTPLGSVGAGPKDKVLIDRVGNKFKHASTLEHLVYSFKIEGVSRALLQELARHRIASLSVKSTRYTLKELKDEEPFITFMEIAWERVKKYLVLTSHPDVNFASVITLDGVRRMLTNGISNDVAKYCLPESYKTELTWTINARSLQNFLHLRTDKSALWEIRDLANTVFEALPADHKYLFEGSLKNAKV